MKRHFLRVRTLVLLVGLTLVAAACGEDLEPSSTPIGPTPSPPPITEDVEYGVQYCSRDGVALLMDIYKPDRPQQETSPAVLYLHAGIWALGNRNTVGGPVEFEELVSRGYVVATMDYSLAPSHLFPAQIEDAKCAVRYLRSHADDHGIDPDKIAAWGASAGGHLAALLGVAGPEAGFDRGDHADVSSDVQAVVDMFGPTNLEAPDYVENAETASREVFGAAGPGAADTLRSASPVTHVTQGDAPFLIIHGARDEVVPLDQSQALAARLQAAGIPVTLVVVENAEHGLAPSGGPPRPSMEEVDRMIGDFLDEALRGRIGNVP